MASAQLTHMGVHVQQQCAGNDVVGRIIGHFSDPTCRGCQRHQTTTGIDVVKGDALGSLNAHLAFGCVAAVALGHHNGRALGLQERARA